MLYIYIYLKRSINPWNTKSKRDICINNDSNAIGIVNSRGSIDGNLECLESWI